MAHNDAIRVTLDATADDGEPGEGDTNSADVENVVGGGGNDTLVAHGCCVTNNLDGGEGNDILDVKDPAFQQADRPTPPMAFWASTSAGSTPTTPR